MTGENRWAKQREVGEIWEKTGRKKGKKWEEKQPEILHFWVKKWGKEAESGRKEGGQALFLIKLF